VKAVEDYLREAEEAGVHRGEQVETVIGVKRSPDRLDSEESRAT
jgi:hypothetical protein